MGGANAQPWESGAAPGLGAALGGEKRWAKTAVFADPYSAPATFSVVACSLLRGLRLGCGRGPWPLPAPPIFACAPITRRLLARLEAFGFLPGLRLEAARLRGRPLAHPLRPRTQRPANQPPSGAGRGPCGTNPASLAGGLAGRAKQGMAQAAGQELGQGQKLPSSQVPIQGALSKPKRLQPAGRRAGRGHNSSRMASLDGLAQQACPRRCGPRAPGPPGRRANRADRADRADRGGWARPGLSPCGRLRQALAPWRCKPLLACAGQPACGQPQGLPGQAGGPCKRH